MARSNNGTNDIVNEDMHHSNCSVGLGISNDHAMQWIAPKIATLPQK